LTYTKLTEEGRQSVRSIIDKLTTVGEAIGGWQSKMNARQSGVDLYIHFDNKVDVMTTTVQFANQLEQAPSLLVDACQRLLDADAAVAHLGQLLRTTLDLGLTPIAAEAEGLL
jgi:hypothetical protein